MSVRQAEVNAGLCFTITPSPTYLGYACMLVSPTFQTISLKIDQTDPAMHYYSDVRIITNKQKRKFAKYRIIYGKGYNI